MRKPDQVIGGIADQDTGDYVDLKRAHQPPAPLRWRQFRDVDRPQHRACADGQPAHKARCQQHGPADGKSSAQDGHKVEGGGIAQRGARAQPLPDDSGCKAAHDGADGRGSDGQTHAKRAQAIKPRDRVDDAGDNNCVEPVQKAAQGPRECRFDQPGIGSHLSSLPLDCV